MGQAKQRGTREQRVAAAIPKVARPSADQRRAQQMKALAGAVDVVMRPLLRALNR